jgi:hypothetical protein
MTEPTAATKDLELIFSDDWGHPPQHGGYTRWVKSLHGAKGIRRVKIEHPGMKAFAATFPSGRPKRFRAHLPPELSGEYLKDDNCRTWGFGDPVFSSLTEGAPTWDMVWVHPAGCVIWQSARPTPEYRADATSTEQSAWKRVYTVETGQWALGNDAFQMRVMEVKKLAESDRETLKPFLLVGKRGA